MSNIKNVQAFGKLTGICTGYGGAYKPGQQNLQVNALTTLLINAQQVLGELNNVQTRYDTATNARQLGFQDVRHLSSRIMSVLRSSGADPLRIQDAQASVSKIWGRSVKKPAVTSQPTPAATATAPTPSTFSYGRDYATMENYFGKLISTVAAEVKYMPVEPELSVNGLQAKYSELHNLNIAVTQAEVDLAAVRRKRNDLFYTGDGNLFATAVAVKQYVRGVFGFNSNQHAEVSRLRFSKP